MPDNPSGTSIGKSPAESGQPPPSTAPMMPMADPSKFQYQPQAPGGGMLQNGQMTQCNRCNQMVRARDDTYPSAVTHILALALFLCGLPFCIFLPYCFDCFGKPVKRCDNCGNFLQGP